MITGCVMVGFSFANCSSEITWTPGLVLRLLFGLAIAILGMTTEERAPEGP